LPKYTKILDRNGENEAVVTPIGEVLVTGNFSTSDQANPTSAGDILHGSVELAGSDDLRVDGTSPKVFSFLSDPSSSIDLYIRDIRFILVSKHIDPSGASFGPIPSLTNGLLFELQTDGVSKTIANFKITEDFLRTVSNPESDPINRSGAYDTLTAIYDYGGGLSLKGGTSDFVKVTVRDDLSLPQLLYFTCSVTATKVAV